MPFSFSRPSAKTLAAAALSLNFAGIANAGDSIFKVTEKRDVTYLDVGTAIITRDTYLGSGETETDILPYLNAEYKGRLYFKPGTGTGAFLINNDNFRLGTGVNYDFGRSADEVPLLGETGKIKGSLTANVSARYQFAYGVIDTVATVPVTGDLSGARYDVLLSTLLPVSDRLRIAPGVRATFHSSGWLNDYYGISAAQSQFSGLAPVDYSSSLSNIGAHALAFYKLSDNYEVVGTVNYSLLTGDIKDSPLVNSNNGITAILGIARKF